MSLWRFLCIVEVLREFVEICRDLVCYFGSFESVEIFTVFMEVFSEFVEVFVYLWRFCVFVAILLIFMNADYSFVKFWCVIVKIFSLFLGDFKCICGNFVFICGDFESICKRHFHVYKLGATTLEPVTGEISNIDHCVPMPCSAVKL